MAKKKKRATRHPVQLRPHTHAGVVELRREMRAQAEEAQARGGEAVWQGDPSAISLSDAVQYALVRLKASSERERGAELAGVQRGARLGWAQGVAVLVHAVGTRLYAESKAKGRDCFNDFDVFLTKKSRKVALICSCEGCLNEGPQGRAVYALELAALLEHASVQQFAEDLTSGRMRPYEGPWPPPEGKPIARDAKALVPPLTAPPGGMAEA